MKTFFSSLILLLGILVASSSDHTHSISSSPSRNVSSEQRNCVALDGSVEDNDYNFKRKNVSPLSKEDFCSRTAKAMTKRLCFESGRLGVENDGGLLGLRTGVCWWHSQFHRKVNYLTYFDPKDKHEISNHEFKVILRKIHNHEVVKIPGYSSFPEFVNDPKFKKRPTLVKRFLQAKMAEGSFLKMEWIKGFEGRANIAEHRPDKLAEQREEQIKQFNDVYRMVRNPDPTKVKTAYVMLQDKGAVAHSLLIYDAEILQIGTDRYSVIYAQDSNHQAYDPTFAISISRTAHYFDTKTAQWYNQLNFGDLLDTRAGKPSSRKIEANGWTMKLQNEKEHDRLNEGFKKFCGKDLFL